jgi:hypothetical protein
MPGSFVGSMALSAVQAYRSSGQASVLGSLYFHFYTSYTPYVFGVVPHAIAPGDDDTLLGDFRWTMLSMHFYERQDPRGYIRKVRMGGFLYVFNTSYT